MSMDREMYRDYRKESMDFWSQSRADLATAVTLLDAGVYYASVFFSQQAAEKALKAICERRRMPHFGHNLNVLRQAIEAELPVTDAIRGACARLNRYYIPTRYPDAFDQGAPADQFYEADARQAVQDVESVLQFAVDAIGPA